MDRRKTAVRVVMVTVLLMVSASLLQAQQEGCSDDKPHEFDFWIGEWEVTAGDEERKLGSATL